jgi:ABC-2 type transport system permease protein
VNRQHLLTFVWLRWRLMQNQWRRAGKLNTVLMSLLVGLAVVLSVPLGVGCFVLGLYAIPKATPAQLMYAWDGLIVGFLFFWSIGLIAELQRTEPLALSKFLHLPVPVSGAFVINFVSSLLSLSLIFFVPLMVAYCAALVWVKGAGMLVSFALLAGFLLMVTAVTYQFQGWLASLMTNPRRRRTIVVTITAVFILVFQLPNLFNLVVPWRSRQPADQGNRVNELKELDQSFQAGRITMQEYTQRQQQAADRHKQERNEQWQQTTALIERTVTIVNLALPIGWLPIGVMSAAHGSQLPALLACAGLGSIGGASLRRAYRTTLRMYQGEDSASPGKPVPTAARADSGPRGNLLVEAHVPGLSEPVSAIALAGLRSLLRAPEAKMMLLTPVLMAIIFGAVLLNRSGDTPIPEFVRPSIALGAMALVLFSMLQLTANQFGFDRDGFRVYVLSALSRRDILLGKNLSFAPLGFGLAAIMLAVVQLTCPLRIDHFLAMIPLSVSMFLLFCPLANLLSIYAPMTIAAGSMKPAQPRLIPVLIHMLAIFIFFPISQIPTFLPLGIEALCEYLQWTAGVPLGLLLSLAECAAAVWLYRRLVNWQGTILQEREQRILEVVTNRAA